MKKKQQQKNKWEDKVGVDNMVEGDLGQMIGQRWEKVK